MPFVHIELLEGRSQEAKAKIAEEVRASIAKHANAPKENIHIIFQDMKQENYFKVTKEEN